MDDSVKVLAQSLKILGQYAYILSQPVKKMAHFP